MDGPLASLFVVGAVFVVTGLWAMAVFNRLVTLKHRTLNAFSQIDVQLVRRHDLIPNLVEVAGKYMAHERETLEAVTRARSRAVDAARTLAGGPADVAAIQGMAGAQAVLAGALDRLFAVVENYPDLKADAVMRDLTEELRSTENKVAFARQAYNDAVNAYNVLLQSFPHVLLARPCGFAEAHHLVFPGTDWQKTPKVALS
ncbi:MAG: LemA family protein [Thermodesulfobacteriota bacterium]